MEKTKAYRPILKGAIMFSIASVVLFLAMLYSDNFWPLLVTFGVMGASNCQFCALLGLCWPREQASASCRCCL